MDSDLDEEQEQEKVRSHVIDSDEINEDEQS